MSNKAANTARQIKETARTCGFDYCGISRAGFLEEEAPRLENWLREQKHGSMQYMENHFDKRLDPTLLVPGAKIVISLLYNYYNPQKQSDPEAPKISMYAYHTDYHFVVKEKLKQMVELLQQQIGDFEGRVFVDSAPVLEKAWAVKSGTGWMGKHSNLINKNSGSYFFLAEIICDLDAEPDGAVKDYCGTCTRCIDACPTDAIEQPYLVNGSKCISYATIELKEALIPAEFKGKMDNWMFGCDICQQVCPWNRFSSPHKEAQFIPDERLMDMRKKDWEELTEEVFRELFRNSPVKRSKFEGLKRNIGFLRDADT